MFADDASYVTDRDNIVSINEMLLAMKRLQKVPNETKLQRIVEVLDEDCDGNININLALKVIPSSFPSCYLYWFSSPGGQ